jgi:hypothetical protein
LFQKSVNDSGEGDRLPLSLTLCLLFRLRILPHSSSFLDRNIQLRFSLYVFPNVVLIVLVFDYSLIVVIFTVITIITTMTSPFMDAALILWANIYVTLFGVVLATGTYLHRTQPMQD